MRHFVTLIEIGMHLIRVNPGHMGVRDPVVGPVRALAGELYCVHCVLGQDT